MKTISLNLALILVLLFPACTHPKNRHYIAEAPAGQAYTHIDTAGITVIPNGRLLTPAGKSFRVAPHPFGLTLSCDGNLAVTANSGVRPLSVTLIRNITSTSPKIMQIPSGATTDKGVLASVFMGLAVSPSNDTLYVAGGQENKIYLFDTNTGTSLGDIDCSYRDDSTDYTDGYIGDMVMNKAGNLLYAVDQINFRMCIIDPVKKRLLRSVPVGRYPFGIALSPDEQTVWVANVGMYVYKPIRGIDPENIESTAPSFPPFAYGSEESVQGIVTDSIVVPGLGEPNVSESFSVFAVDVSHPEGARVRARIKTGVLIGEPVEGIPAVGGSSPNSLVATDKYVFVSNGNNDNVSVISTENDTVVRTIHLDLDPRIDHLRGKIPFGLAVSPDQKLLFVAEAGINAVAVVSLKTFQVLGHIPTGWFPSKVQVTPDGNFLVVANAKGYGSGPNGGTDFKPGPMGSYIGHLMRGTVSVIKIPGQREIEKMTHQVIENNFRFRRTDDPEFSARKTNPVPLYPGQERPDSLSPIKYLVFITKENRTFDEIFGEIEGARGAPGLARYGSKVTFTNRAGTDTVRNATVMPNHLTLARRFAIGDNFYVDADVSADGHRWLANTYPNEWVETSAPASYGGNRNFKWNSSSPGYFAFTGSAGAIYPEDYNEAGSLWDQLYRFDVPFFNFGEGVMFEPASYEKTYKTAGIRHLVNYPLPKPLFEHSSKNYPTFNMGIPDQYRVDVFIREFRKRWLDAGNPLPALMTLILPNDHGAGERPADGYPYRESYMADNDLALGRLVAFLSQTPYWKNMAIIVTEDDAQNGVDHVDAHRSVLMVISPWAKKGFVGHDHYSFGSIFKTFWNILSVPYLNEYDATATDLSGLFTDQPDFSPYRALPVDPRIFDPKTALTPLNEEFNWNAVRESPEIDYVPDMIKASKEQDRDRLEGREQKKNENKKQP